MTTQVTPGLVAPAAADWGKRRRQFLSVIKIELSRNFFNRRAIWIYFLAFAPAVIVFLHSLESPGGRRCTIEQDTEILAGIVQVFYLRFGIFFGCLGIFTWLLRGEVVQRSLHYYFLAPMRRETMVIGKYLAGAITTSLVFSAGVFLSFMLMYCHFGHRRQIFVFY